MTLKDYMRVVRQRLVVVALMIVVVTNSAIFFSLRQDPEYTATAKLLVEAAAKGTEAGGVLEEVLDFQSGGILTEAERLQSTVVAERVAKRLGLPQKPEEVIEQIQVQGVSHTFVLLVSGIANDPVLAQNLANAFVEEYISLRKEEALAQADEAVERSTRRIGEIRKALDEVDRRLRDAEPGSSDFELLMSNRDGQVGLLAVHEGQRQALMDKTALVGRGVGEVLVYATAPKDQTSPNHIRNAVLGFIVGIPLALGMALLLDSLNDSIKTKEEAERLTKSDAIALVPEDEIKRTSDLASRDAPYSAVAEAYRGLRVNVELASGRRLRSILVTSPGPEEGKSTSASNLAVAFAQAGTAVTLVSADLRRPSLHRYFDIGEEPGLSDLIKGEATLDQVLQQPSANLKVVPSGSNGEHPDRLFAGIDIRMLMRDMVEAGQAANEGNGNGNGNGNRYGNGIGNGNGNGHGRSGATSLTIFDAPALLGAAESSALAPCADGVILVLRAGVTRRVAATRAAERIRKVGGKIIGCVLVGVQEESTYQVYGPNNGHDPEQRPKRRVPIGR